MDNKRFGAYVLLALGALRIIVDVAFWAAVAALLILFSLQFPHPAKVDALWLVQKLRFWGDPVLAEIGSWFGWAWPTSGAGLLPIGCGFALLAVKLGVDSSMAGLTAFARKRLPLSDETGSLSASSSSMGISVSSALLALAASSDKAREKIQRRRDRVAHMLDESKRRRCAFLSIDVVDPIEMKQGEDPDRIAASFSAYEDMLEEVFETTSAWKEAWTTDGVMVCYQDVAQAVDGAKRVIEQLKAFNSVRNQLRQPFRVRCGLNEGNVVIFDDSKLEKVADHVIDVAGHMQKHARPDSLWLSSEVYDHLEEKSGFRPTNEHVDGFTVVEWRA